MIKYTSQICIILEDIRVAKDFRLQDSHELSEVVNYFKELIVYLLMNFKKKMMSDE